ncbi:MAG: hypothetical protein JO134_10395 [Xanthobacteraceae bacterium]|nr:hypothetical protein [Xanthobacteraceae bacterium]
MQLTRRRALGLALAASFAPGLRAWAAGQVSDDRAVFWEFGSGASASTIFGYDRIAASLVLDIVDDGTKRATAAKRVIQDFPARVVLPAIKIDPSLQPIVDRLDAKAAAAFRGVVQQSFAQLAPTIDKMPGVEASMLLMAEGQTPPNPSVGGTIVDVALKVGRPSTVLISDTELRGMALSPNLTALDKRIGQDTITYLLDLRAKGGPIGRQFEQLYAARRGGDIHSLSAELIKRGVFVPAQMLNGDAIKYLLGSRLEAALKTDAAASAFVLMPLDALVGNDGIIAALRKGGNSVTATA